METLILVAGHRALSDRPVNMWGCTQQEGQWANCGSSSCADWVIEKIGRIWCVEEKKGDGVSVGWQEQTMVDGICDRNGTNRGTSNGYVHVIFMHMLSMCLSSASFNSGLSQSQVSSCAYSPQLFELSVGSMTAFTVMWLSCHMRAYRGCILLVAMVHLGS
jgi:hypothetical protein